MIVLFILIFAGKKFSDLADDYDKTKWKFVLLGIASYFIMTFGFGLLYGIYTVITNTNLDENNLFLKVIEIPLGILGCFLMYQFLENKWKKEPKKINEIDNIGNNNS